MKNSNRTKHRSAGECGRKRRAARIALVLCLSLLVQLSPAFGLAGSARAEQVQVLHCTAVAETGEGYAGFFVHTHNEDCFDEEGNLVCELREIKAHEHDGSCYDEEGKLTCTKPEVTLHTHTEACYNAEEKLICGKTEVREHIHDENCFAVPETGDDDEADAPRPQIVTFPGEEEREDEEDTHPQIFFFTGDDEKESGDGAESGDEEGNEDASVAEGEDGTAIDGPVFFTLFPENDESDGNEPTGDAEENGNSPEETDDTGMIGGLFFLFPENEEEQADSTEPAGSSEENNADEGDETDDLNNLEASDEEIEEDEETEPAEGDETGGAEEANDADDESDDADESDETDDVNDADEGDETDDVDDEEASDEEIEEDEETEPTEGDETGEAEEANDADDETGEAEEDEETKETDGKDGSGGDEKPETASVPMPAQTFTASTEDVEVYVEADEGAFPEGTTMIVTPVTDEETISAVTEAAEAEDDSEGTVTGVVAVDITFRDAEGRQIEPMIPIRVSMKSVIISESDSVSVVHLPDPAQPETGPQPEDENPPQTEEAAPAGSESPEDAQSEETADGTVGNDAGSGDTDSDADMPAPAPAPVPADTQAAQHVAAETEETSETTESTEPPKPEIIEAELVQPAEDAESPADEIVFESDSFSVYALVGKTIEKSVLASDGRNYRISLTYGDNAGIPAGAALDVREILPETAEAGEMGTAESGAEKSGAAESGDAEAGGAAETAETADVPADDTAAETRTTETGWSEYDEYVAKTLEALGEESGSFGYARFFDITLLDADGEKIQPAEGSTVEVRIELADAESGELNVVHFGEETEVLDATQGEAEGGLELSFEASSFSVYAVVDAPAPYEQNPTTVQTLDELRQNTDEGFLLSLQGPGYATANLNGSSCFIETKSEGAAAVWYFEPVGEANNLYRIFTFVNNVKKYIRNSTGNLVGLEDAKENEEEEQSGTVFEVSAVESVERLFLLKSNSENKWLQHSNGGGGIRFYTDKNNAANTRFTLTYASSLVMPDDYYDLDGRAFGIAYHNDTAAAAAMMATAKDSEHLTAEDMLMRPDVLDNEGILLVAGTSGITDWTFHCVGENRYTITTEVEGDTKYLTLKGKALTLEDGESADAVFTVTAGSGSNRGKYQFTANGYRIEPNLNGNDAGKGFWGTTGTGASTWLNLVERSVLEDGDFNLYTARKVSVSDEVNVYNGQQVVIYTRIWNETEKKYEFYILDHDGTLARCYDVGDNIEWIGSQVNTALWKFTEYLNADGTKNYYYELQNTQYDNYIAPQIGAESIMSAGTIGINLNGRRYGSNYTTIIAWDDTNYAYAGLKHEDGHVTACALADAEDFYFAVVNPVDTEDQLTTVTTVNNNDYGITMKMIDFNNEITKFNGNNLRDSVQHGFFGGHQNNYEPGLLTTNLGDSGYPMTTGLTGKEGRSLGTLFTDMTPVNHLFIQSIYNESGYFEYDSTQNFAHLNADGSFTVYDQLAAIGTSTGTTRTHGQFMPYNSIEAGQYAYDNNGKPITNQTDVLAQELTDLNPRKGEPLYSIPENEADYYFGMEMSASFTQTASGLDAWGHDIIFEFSGDDDFWLYVDGELVLDLGGVRSAMTGSVNFRTGEVKNGGKIKLLSATGTTEKSSYTLREVFESNYRTRNPGATQEEVNAYLETCFEAGSTVFRDYTNHTMRMFYMERGAGASNLHMRFNLAAVRPGSFTLSKTLSGADEANNDLIEFPYQVYYSTAADGGDRYHLLDNSYTAVYEGTNSSVKYLATFTPAGGTTAYSNVFFLKPGQSAEFTMPNEVIDYYVVECAVNPDIYDVVRVNGEALKGTATANTVNGKARQDFATDKESLENRAQVKYDNHVREGAMRTLLITKKLYDVDGKTLLSYPENSTLYTIRLSLGNENAAPENLPLANFYAYYVRNPEGNYCRWDASSQAFVSLGIGDYDKLQAYFAANGWSSTELENVIFRTSMNGTISKIPANYTVEIRNLIIDTRFKVEERAWEIPRGYTLRQSDGYTRVDGGRNDSNRDEDGVSQPYAGLIRPGEDPEIEVRNQKGWGLTVKKIWTDQDFMSEHDDIYFAVFLRTGASDSDILYDGSVRRLPEEQEIYYFFDDLTYDGVIYSFPDFIIREVTLTGDNIVADKDGNVSGYDDVIPIENGGTLSIGGTPVGGTHQEGYAYTVSCVTGESTGRNENVRTDTVTNSRPGIALYKADRSGEWKDGKLEGALAGAVFTLKEQADGSEDGRDVAAESYTSREDGLITIAYLNAGTYVLNEIATPRGYVALDNPIVITVEMDGSFRVEGDEETFLFTEATGTDMAALTVKNRRVELRVLKVDAETEDPIEGTEFALYRQVTDISDNPRRDYNPMTGYSALLTDGKGLLEKVSIGNLNRGTYYLVETKAAEGYELPKEDLCFTIENDGTVTVDSAGHGTWLSSEWDQESETLIYTITIPNGKQQSVSFRLVDISDSSPLAGAVFNLNRIGEKDRETDEDTGTEHMFTGMISNEEGMLTLNGETVFRLAKGTYALTEIKAPAGYIPLTEPVMLTVGDEGVTWKQNVNTKDVSEATQDPKTGAYLVTVTNAPGPEMPETGGSGTAIFVLAGAILTLTAGAVLTMRRKREGGD